LYLSGKTSVVTEVEFVSDIMFIISDRWCDIILNMHVPTDDKSNDTKNNFNEELELVLDQYPVYCIKILLGHFRVKVGREGIFNQ